MAKWQSGSNRLGPQPADFGNSFEFAAECLVVHWILEHAKDPGNEARPYECDTCRGLSARVGLKMERPFPPPKYIDVMQVVRAWSSTIDGKLRVEAGLERRVNNGLQQTKPRPEKD